MTYTPLEETRLPTGSISSGNQNRYLGRCGLPIRLQAVMVQLFNRTDWTAREHGILQTEALSCADLAEKLGCSPRTVKRYLKELKELGELRAHTQFGGMYGRQSASIYTLPKVVQFLKNLTVKEAARDLEKPLDAVDQGALEEERGDTDVTPSKQKSSTKTNTYIRFLDISKKEEFVSITGSILHLPQLRKVIERARPGINPDAIYKCFREFIARDDFSLNPNIPHYFRLLGIFARRYRGPGTPVEDFKRQNAFTPPAKVEPVEFSDQSGPIGDAQRALAKAMEPAVYRSWFSKVTIEWTGDVLKLLAPSVFHADYLKTHHSRHLDMLSEVCRGRVLVGVQAA